MSPRKSSKRKASKGKAGKGKPKKAKAVRRAKPARKKVGRKKSAGKGKGTRAAVPVVFRRTGGEPATADTVDTLGEWHHDHEVDTQQYAEDDIPPDYGGSE